MSTQRRTTTKGSKRLTLKRASAQVRAMPEDARRRILKTILTALDGVTDPRELPLKTLETCGFARNGREWAIAKVLIDGAVQFAAQLGA